MLLHVPVISFSWFTITVQLCVCTFIHLPLVRAYVIYSRLGIIWKQAMMAKSTNNPEIFYGETEENHENVYLGQTITFLSDVVAVIRNGVLPVVNS